MTPAGTASVNVRATSTPAPDWGRVTYLLHASRALDDIEETRLLPERKVLYQFSARGHDFAQILLGLQLTDPHDGVTVYYRSRPADAGARVELEDAAAGPLARAGAVQRRPRYRRRLQYADSGWPDGAAGLRRRRRAVHAGGRMGPGHSLSARGARRRVYARSIAVVLGGDASVATNGFWSALTMATTLQLPMLFYIEDNGFGISVPRSCRRRAATSRPTCASFCGPDDPRGRRHRSARGGGADRRARVAQCARSGARRCCV